MIVKCPWQGFFKHVAMVTYLLFTRNMLHFIPYSAGTLLCKNHLHVAETFRYATTYEACAETIETIAILSKRLNSI